MPEGDTVHKVATYLSRVLVGERLVGARMHGRRLASLSQARILAVSSTGKHLFVALEGGCSLRVHLGMSGSWHRYPTGQRWQKPERRATLVLSLPTRDYVCFDAKEVEILATSGLEMRDRVARLGQDLSRETPHVESLLERARSLLHPATELVDILLDQRIASGIGNVYKSEVLFLEGCSPRLRLEDLSPDTFGALYRTAAQLLRDNLGGGPRITRNANDGRGIHWVYGRAGRPCFRCGTGLLREYLGRHARSTYWCPICQADRDGRPPPSGTQG
jgi:endonuclease-8